MVAPPDPKPRGPGLARCPGADLCGIADLDEAIVEALLGTALSLAKGAGSLPWYPHVLAETSILAAFSEPSTRTRISFEVAAQRLGAGFIAFDGGPASSSVKGETALDALHNLDRMGFDAIIVRTATAGWPRALTTSLRARVISAGDGAAEHPTQALLDAATILEAFECAPRPGRAALAGLRVAICGDLRHSRVAGSGLALLPRLGATVVVAGPPGLVPAELPPAVTQVETLDAAVNDADVVMMLRIQRERLSPALELPDDATYHARWGLTPARLALASPSAIVLHPGPINRGVEIADAVADGPQSRILRQVRLGVAVRMAVLAYACGRLDRLMAAVEGALSRGDGGQS